MDIEHFSLPLLAWYDKNKRDMIWRDHFDPYYIWLSEIMLQQTRIEAAKEYFIRFTNELPDIASLAQVSEDRLMKLWEGLGYYNRARNLQKAAKILVDHYCRPISTHSFPCRESARIQLAPSLLWHSGSKLLR